MITQGGLLGKGDGLGHQQSPGVRPRAAVIPLSQAGTWECLDHEACVLGARGK